MAACRARARCMRSSQFAYASAPAGGLPVGTAGSRCVPGASSLPLSLELIEELLLMCLQRNGVAARTAGTGSRECRHAPAYLWRTHPAGTQLSQRREQSVRLAERYVIACVG